MRHLSGNKRIPGASQAHEPVEVFFSYSHEDEELRDKLAGHLSLLERQGVIRSWHDREIRSGTEWRGQIDRHLDTAGLILLLVSADFLNSDYCYDVEMKRALERGAADEARVIPIILRPVDWRGAPFSELQFLPKDAKPVTSWKNIDEAFASIAEEIRKTVCELSGARIQEQEPRLTSKPTPIFTWPRLIVLILLLAALAVAAYRLIPAQQSAGGGGQPRVESAPDTSNPQQTEPSSKRLAAQEHTAPNPARQETAAQRSDAARHRSAFALGMSVAMMGQSSQMAGRPIFEGSLRELEFPAGRVREFGAKYAAIEDSARAKKLDYYGFQIAKTSLLQSINDQLGAWTGEPHLAYTRFGYDVCCLMLLLRFWDQLRDKGNAIETARDSLTSLREHMRRVSLPGELAARIGEISADELANAEGREVARRVLSDAFSQFDLSPL